MLASKTRISFRSRSRKVVDGTNLHRAHEIKYYIFIVEHTCLGLAMGSGARISATPIKS